MKTLPFPIPPSSPIFHTSRFAKGGGRKGRGWAEEEEEEEEGGGESGLLHLLLSPQNLFKAWAYSRFLLLLVFPGDSTREGNSGHGDFPPSLSLFLLCPFLSLPRSAKSLLGHPYSMCRKRETKTFKFYTQFFSQLEILLCTK